MRRLWCCLLLAAGMMCVPVCGAAPGIEWETTYGGNGCEYAYSMVPLAGGDVLLCGSSSYNADTFGGSDLCLGEVGDGGSREGWTFYGGTEWDNGMAIQATSDGGWILAGSSESNDVNVSGNHGELDAWVVKLNPDRTTAWQQCLGGIEADSADFVIQTADGGYLVTGKTSSPELPGYTGWDDAFVAKLLPDGTLDWMQCYGGTNIDGALDAIETPGGYLIRGYTGSDDLPGYHGFWDLWLINITKSGAVDWQRCYGGSDLEINHLYDFGRGLISCPDGYLVLATTKSTDGDVSVPVHGSADIWLLKIAPDGSILSQTAIGGEAYEKIGTIRTASGGGYILAASTHSTGGDVTGKHGAADNADYWVVRLAPDLSIVWQKCLGGSHDDFAYDVCEITPGVFEIAGHTLSDDGDVTDFHMEPGFRCADAWIVRLDAEDGGATPTPEFPGFLIPIAFVALIGGIGLCLRRRL